MSDTTQVTVIGAGLAGCEAAFRLAERGIRVELIEMRPETRTEAHQSGDFAELVCSNSFKSLSPVTAHGELKLELELLDSLAIRCARKSSVPAGEALAVDRDLFSREMTEAVSAHPRIRVSRRELRDIPSPEQGLAILATGPLTSAAMSEALRQRIGTDHFYFYDAISPIVEASSLNHSIVFPANRYGKATRSLDRGQDQGADADYLNCPMSKEEYASFLELLLHGERVQARSFEKLKHFEGCMPIEEMADRGPDTLRFGPMKPVGLDDPRTGRHPWAVVQLRPENRSRSAFNLVGFQTKLKYGEQARVFRSIPGLENAEFLRFGSMHRNSFVDAPRALNLDLSLRNARHLMLAGQITGVEGYLESAAIGLVAAIFAEARLRQRPLPSPPAGTALHALLSHLSNNRNPDYQPSGINFGLFDESSFEAEFVALRSRFPKKLPKDERRRIICETARERLRGYAERLRQQ